MIFFKVYYDTRNKEVHSLMPVHDQSTPVGVHTGFVICEESDLVKGYHTDGDVNLMYYAFPLNDVAVLKKIAATTIDYWRQAQQGSGYTHTTTGVTYGSDDRTRSLLVGKIQEMQVLSTASGIFPNIQGVPVNHTLAEIEAIGVGMAHKVEADYIQAVSLTQQVMDPAVVDLAGIEAVLAPVLGAV